MADNDPGEAILEPDLPIVDAHHHLWLLSEAALEAMGQRETILTAALVPTYRRTARYLLDEYLADVQTGHNVRASVFIDAHAMYRADGPAHLKSVGEVEFVNGVAAMAASDLFGPTRACAGIVGGIDLRLGHQAEEVLQAQLAAGGDRYRGVRGAGIVYDSDPQILGAAGYSPHVLADPDFRTGFGYLEPLGLSFDIFLLEPQLPDLIELARAFPDTQIILNHLGSPVGVGQYAGQREVRYPIWRENMQILAGCENVAVKLGGLGTPLAGFDSFGATPPASSMQLAAEWTPYVEIAIEAFGVDRCMFESNFPVDAATCSYPVIWNAFKRICASASQAEKAALFAETACRIYRLEL